MIDEDPDLDLLSTWRTHQLFWPTAKQVARLLSTTLTALRASANEAALQLHADDFARAELRMGTAIAALVPLALSLAQHEELAPTFEQEAHLPESLYRATDVKGTLLWLAVRYGARWALVPLIATLADVPADFRSPDHHSLVENLAVRLPGQPDAELVAKTLRLEAPKPASRAFVEARPAEEQPEPDGVRVLPEGTKEEAFSRDQRSRLKRLLAPLRLAPWPGADDLGAVLLAEFPWASAAIAALKADLVLAEATSGSAFRLRPLVLVGPPGCGKSRLVSRLLSLVADRGGPGGIVYPVAGSTDNRALAGTARGWSSACESLPVGVMLNHGVANPVLCLDEIDKATGGHNGDLRQTLLTMVEPTTAKGFLDEGIGLPVDLSRVTWLATANDRMAIPPLLRTRFRFVVVSQPRPCDYGSILAGALADLAAEFGCHPAMLPQEPDLMHAVAEGFRAGRLSARGAAAGIRRAVELGAGLVALETRH